MKYIYLLFATTFLKSVQNTYKRNFVILHKTYIFKAKFARIYYKIILIMINSM